MDDRMIVVWLVKRLVICALPAVVAILLGASDSAVVVVAALGALAFMESRYDDSTGTENDE